MIRYLLITVLLFSCICMSAQELSLCRQVVGASGITNTTESNLQWSYTVGETAVFTLRSASGTFIMTQGFQQPDVCVPSSVTSPEIAADWQLQIYPNPASQWINVNFVNDGNPLHALIVNQLGQIVQTNNAIWGQNAEPIDCTQWQAGLYFLVLTDLETRRSVTARIVKL
jgi:hypothetical protein